LRRRYWSGGCSIQTRNGFSQPAGGVRDSCAEGEPRLRRHSECSELSDALSC
jgi:hypothetical protein